MQPSVLLLALLLPLGCSGLPLHSPDLASKAERGLGAAVAQLNSAYATRNLYRPTSGSVTRVIPSGLDTDDLLMTFGIKETVCGKDSAKDPGNCTFRPGFFVPTYLCASRVRVAPSSTRVMSLRCGQDGSSSSESSEEMFSRYIIPFGGRVPAPSAPPPPPPPPPPPVHPGHSFHSRPAVEVQPRGDAISNYLE